MGMELDMLRLTLEEEITNIIEKHTDIIIATDEDTQSKISELIYSVMEKYTQVQEETEESELEYHGDMDEFIGEE